jgi:hypothetical protein
MVLAILMHRARLSRIQARHRDQVGPRADLRARTLSKPPRRVFNTARRAMVQRAQPPAWKPGMTFSYLKNGKILFAKATSRASAVLDHLMAPDE